MKVNYVICVLLILSLLLCGCTQRVGNKETGDPITTNKSEETSKLDSSFTEISPLDPDNMFTDRDFDVSYDVSQCVYIRLNGDSIEADSKATQVSGTSVRLTAEGSYIVSGTLNDGQIIVDADKSEKIQIILNEASIHSANSAPIYILQADKVFITLADHSENSLSNGGAFAVIDDNNIDAVVFSKDDLTFNGSGSLAITSPAGHGIVTKDDLAVSGGRYTIEADGHGLSGKQSVRIAGGSFVLDTGKDGIHAENNDDPSLGFCYISGGDFLISADGDGIDATSSVGIYGGTLDITTNGVPIGGTSASQTGANASRGGMMMAPSIDVEFETSSKGINADAVLSVYGGDITVNAASHCIHSEGEMIITGGLLQLSSTYEKGISAHGNLTIDGESTVIDIIKSTEGIESKSVMTINNGTITVIASDDALNATGGKSGAMMGGGMGGTSVMGGNQTDCMIINGGYVEVYSDYDCLDANGNLVLNGGVIKASKTGGAFTGQNSVFDPDGTLTIGDTVTFLSTSGGKSQAKVSTTQHTITVFGESTYKSETYISVKDETGILISEYIPHGDFNSFLILSPVLEIGKTYTISIGDETHEVILNEHNTVIGTEEASSGMGGFGGGMGTRPGGGMRPDGGGQPGGGRFPGGNGGMGNWNGNFPWQSTTPSETEES